MSGLLFVGIFLFVCATVALIWSAPNVQPFMVSWMDDATPPKSSKVIRACSNLLSHLDKWNMLGNKLKQQYNQLEKETSYHEFMMLTVVKSFILVPLLLVAAVILENQIFYLLMPLSVGLLFSCYVADIRAQHKKRQQLLIRDLPNLISKMMIALETGTSFEKIFAQVAEQSHPLLAEMIKRLLANMKHQSLQYALQRFAQEVNVPIMYDFVSVVYVGVEKGYKAAMDDLDMIKNDLKHLRKISLVEQTKGNPEKMNIPYLLLCVHIVVWLLCTGGKIFTALSTI